MKLTREQVSALSNVELNLAMIWCYPPKKSVFITILNNYAFDSKIVNYLTDYNLTIPLAHKSNLLISLSGEYPDDGSICWSQFKEHVSDHENPLRAICEVLLMIAMECEA